MSEHPDAWFWRALIYNYRRMAATCEDHGDADGAAIYVNAEAKAIEWLGSLNAKTNRPDYVQEKSG